MQSLLSKFEGRRFASIDDIQNALDRLRKQDLKPADWLQVSELQARLYRGDRPTPADVARVGWSKDATNWVGKRVLEKLPETSFRKAPVRLPEDDYSDIVGALYDVPAGTSPYAIPDLGGSLQRELSRYATTAVDGGLVELARMRGWKTPEVGSEGEVQERINQGWTEIWRGVRGNNGANLSAVVGESGRPGRMPAQTSEQLLDGLRTDPNYGYGSGLYGNGLYFSVNPRAAQIYAGYDMDRRGAYVRAALRPDAHVIEYDDLKYLMDEWFTKERASANPREALMYGFAADPGRFAMMLGFDAIRVPAGLSDGAYDDESGKELKAEQLVILNRGAMIVEEVNRKP